MSIEDGRVKIGFLGDTNSGKTFLIQTYLTGHPPNEEKPTLFECYYKKIKADGKRYRLYICDTGGLEDYRRMEKMSFLNTDLFIICLDSNNADSLKGAGYWVDNVKGSGIPVILCLTKCDRPREINMDGVLKLANKHNVYGVFECSAFDKRSLRNLFENAVKACIEGATEQRTGCLFCC